MGVIDRSRFQSDRAYRGLTWYYPAQDYLGQTHARVKASGLSPLERSAGDDMFWCAAPC